MQIDWSFPQYILNSQNIGTEVQWICTGTEGSITAAMHGEIISGDITTLQSVPTDQITNEMLKNWASGQIDMVSIEKQVTDMVNNYSPSDDSPT